MTTQEIADRLVAICRTGQFDEAYKELFAEDAVAIEPAHTRQPDVKGLDNLLKKNAEFGKDVKEFHETYISDPVVGGNHFSVGMGIDFTRQNGERVKMEEICVYKVEDGKVVKEQFFF